MTKKSAKQKKKGKQAGTAGAGGSGSAAAKPPSLLVPSTPSVPAPTASTLNTALEGLPQTGGGGGGGQIEGLPSGDDGGVKGYPAPVPIEIASKSTAQPSSTTTTSPPQNAASVLAALASKSPRPASPRPSTSPQPPQRTASPGTGTSPRPPSYLDATANPNSPASHIRYTRTDGHRRMTSETSDGRPASIHSTASASNAPTLVRREGKGVAFMPSASHFVEATATVALGDGPGSETVGGKVKKPHMERTASGVAREIVQSEKDKDKDAGKGKGKKLTKKGGGHRGAEKTEEDKARKKPEGSVDQAGKNQDDEVEQDPASEAQVEAMVKKGKIEVGVAPGPEEEDGAEPRALSMPSSPKQTAEDQSKVETERGGDADLAKPVEETDRPETVSDATTTETLPDDDVGQQPRSSGDAPQEDDKTAAEGEGEKQDGSGVQTLGTEVSETKAPTPRSSRPSRSSKNVEKPASVVSLKGDAGQRTATSPIGSAAGTSPAPKRRGLLDAAHGKANQSGFKNRTGVESDDELILNEVSDGKRSGSVGTADSAEGALQLSKKDANEGDPNAPAGDSKHPQENTETDLYIPPYKTRKPYKPMPLTSAQPPSDLAISLFAAVTRHHESPYNATRRLEVRLAWHEPETWLWVPGRKYIPTWKVDYVARRMEDGVVRKVIKGALEHTPVLWRLADWF